MIVDIQRLKPGQSHGLRSLFQQYVLNKVLYLAGLMLLKRLNKIGQAIRRQQKELLDSIIKANHETKVARHFGLHTISSMEEFRSKVPLTKSSDYEEFSKDVRENGTADVFFPGRADYVAMTSGTTSGKSKHFPKSLKIMKSTMGRWIILSLKCMFDISTNQYLRYWLCVRATVRTTLCPSGVRTGLISGIASSFSLTPYVVPSLVNDMYNEKDVIYLNLIFGLKYPDICNLFFSTAHMANLFFLVLERRWEEVCNDIQAGTISKSISICDKDRLMLCQYLNGGDANRANFLRGEFKKGFLHIVPRIWPECPGLFCLGTGAFQTQVRICFP